MEWIEQPQFADRLLKNLDERNISERWESHPHLTELIYCLTRAWYNRFQPLPATRKEALYFVLGLGLQKSLTNNAESVTGELDGIYYEIDFVNKKFLLGGSHIPLIGELKTTRMALTKHPNDWSDGWRKQLLGYLKTQGTTDAVYYVLYVIPPELKSWHVVATEQEVEANWEWLLIRKEIYEQSVMNREPPKQYVYNEPWECKDCRYSLFCSAVEARDKGLV